MIEDTKKALFTELVTVTEKYGVRHAAFCGTGEDGDFVGGIVSTGKLPHHDLFAVILNIGRLWQYARELSRRILVAYEK